MIAEPAVDEALWHEAASLGWFGLALPEDANGAGYGLVAAALLFHALGRAAIPGATLHSAGARRPGPRMRTPPGTAWWRPRCRARSSAAASSPVPGSARWARRARWPRR